MFKIINRTILASIVFSMLFFSCGNKKELPQDYWESPVKAVKQTQRKIPFGDLRNYQYCEILTTFKKGDSLITEVYATMLCNECPEEKWDQLSENKLKSILNAEAIRFNGPRHWVLNKIKGSSKIQYNKVASFGDIQMILAAQINGEVKEIPYIENRVKRWTVYTFKEGNEVYKLINPNKEEYIMQSYSRMMDRAQSIDSLHLLSSRLNLPDGWSFKTETLKKDFKLITEGEAFVIVDDLMNAYQKIVYPEKTPFAKERTSRIQPPATNYKV